MELHEILALFQELCVFISLPFAVQAMRDKESAPNIKLVVFYSFLSALLGIDLLASPYLHGSIWLDELTTSVSKVLVLLHFVLVTRFIFLGMEEEHTRKLLVRYSVLFLLVALILVVKLLSHKDTFYENAAVNLMLLFFCLLYFKDLLDRTQRNALLQLSSFWIVSGVFLCLSVTVPIFAIKKYFIHQSSTDRNLVISGIASAAYGIMHLFFIKAYVCSMQPERVS